MTFEDICAIEPKLKEIADEMSNLKDEGSPDGFDATGLWCRIYKQRMYPLVGWEAKDSRISGSNAYDVAYQHLYNLLPDDRDCDEVDE